MEYKFEKVGLDTTKLSYQDKEFEIKRDINLMKELQSINYKAKKKMTIDLAKEGVSRSDLIKTIETGNKKLEDNSAIIELEKVYVEEMTMQIFDDLCNKHFNMGITELMNDIGLTDETESAIFGEKLVEAFTGINSNQNTPRDHAKKIN